MPAHPQLPSGAWGGPLCPSSFQLDHRSSPSAELMGVPSNFQCCIVAFAFVKRNLKRGQGVATTAHTTFKLLNFPHPPHHPQFGNTKCNPVYMWFYMCCLSTFFYDVSFIIVGGTPNHLWCWRGGLTPVTRESLLIERVSRLCHRPGELRTCCPSCCCIRYLGFIARPAAAHSCTTCVEARGEFERTFGGSS